MRNLQLSLYGLPFSIMYMFAKDGRSRPAGGLMVGFNAVAWAVVGLQVAKAPYNLMPSRVRACMP